MPILNTSEYKRSFPWMGTSQKLVGKENKTFIGREATYSTLEPPIQRKRRVPHIDESLNLEVIDRQTEDDFLLCGAKSEKFSDSIPYRNQLKMFRKNRGDGTVLFKKESGDVNSAKHSSDKLSTPDAPRSVKAISQLTMAKDKASNKTVHKALREELRLPLGERDSRPVVEDHLGSSQRDIEERGVRVQNLERDWVKSAEPNDKLIEVVTSSPAAVDVREERHFERTRELEEQLALAREQARRQERESAFAREKLISEQREGKNKERLAAERRLEKLRSQEATSIQQQQVLRQKVKDAREEAHRLNLVAESDKQTGADLFNYAKRRELGVAAPREPSIARLSEYQREFDKKKPLRQSVPVLRAEDVVFHSYLDPPKSAVVASSKDTEYRRQFKPFRYNSVPQRRRSLSPESHSHLVKASPQRSRTPPPVPSVTVAGRSYAPYETLQPESRFSFPLGVNAHRRPTKSEYAEKFGDFRDVVVKEVELRQLENHDETEEKQKLHAIWLQDVIELRRKAKEYKLRSGGTHFSRDHLGQVFGFGADAWERSSGVPSASVRSVQVGQDSTSAAAPARSNLSACSVESQAPSRASLTVTERNSVDDEFNRSQPLRIPQSNDVGRLATPRAQGLIRHHFDRTTPTHGGAMLSSPPTPVVSTSVPQISQLLEESRELLNRTRDARERAEHNWAKLVSPMPAAGLPTQDSCELLAYDDEHAPPPPSMPLMDIEEFDGEQSAAALHLQDKNHSAAAASSRKQQRRRPLTQGGNGGGQQRNFARAEPVSDKEKLHLSLSERSDVSSCISSLASETLDRARRRRDEFWGPRD